MDIQACTDTGGGYNIVNTAAGEWLEYAINVQDSRRYQLRARIASAQAGNKTFSVLIDGSGAATNTFTYSDGWSTWHDVATDSFDLEPGIHTLRFKFETGGFNLNWIQLDEMPPPPPP